MLLILTLCSHCHRSWQPRNVYSICLLRPFHSLIEILPTSHIPRGLILTEFLVTTPFQKSDSKKPETTESARYLLTRSE